jgi:small nuclear ribonucleoprotein (snRNP)-like protein
MAIAKKYSKIKPNYIKDEKGKTTEVYLDLKSYESILGRLKAYDEIRKKIKQKKAQNK